MGLYLNSRAACAMYRSEKEKPYFVDKTRMLEELFPMVSGGNHFICVTRPRRFGKTMAANMIGAFFSNACASDDIFDSLAVAKSADYRKHLNRYNVIYIDFSEIDDECESYEAYISNIKELLREDLHTAYPDIEFRLEKGSPAEDLRRINQKTGDTFVFVLDEWDAIFHMSFMTQDDRKKYLSFLKNLLKGKAYVSLAYMTGILPIAKYSSGSELNMFLEYSMVSQVRFGDYFGFTGREVDELYERYCRNVKMPAVTREGLREWYDGYYTRSGERLYNPRSVVAALENNQLGSYWTSAGPYDEIFYYIEHNIADVRDALGFMVAGESVKVNIQEYAATAMELENRDEIFSAMVVYGFLSVEDGRVSIPNRELMIKFGEMLRRESSLGYVYRLAKESERMIAATHALDTKTMEEILSYAHDTETPLLSYNKEADLSAIVNLVYLSARDEYDIQREDKSGIGYVDFIFYPKWNRNADCIILELKAGHTADDALRQIRDKKYVLRFRGKLQEVSRYTGRILLVGISYDKETKKHECKIEVLDQISDIEDKVRK